MSVPVSSGLSSPPCPSPEPFIPLPSPLPVPVPALADNGITSSSRQYSRARRDAKVKKESNHGVSSDMLNPWCAQTIPHQAWPIHAACFRSCFILHAQIGKMEQEGRACFILNHPCKYDSLSAGSAILCGPAIGSDYTMALSFNKLAKQQ